MTTIPMSPSKINEQIKDDMEKASKSDEISIGIGRELTSMSTMKQSVKTEIVGDECKYLGDIYGDKKHGKGILSWTDGRMYTGAFFADQRHGFGIFQTPNISEFKGLYRQDERFGPGILIYKSTQSADVGFWLSEDLIRLLYPHPSITFDIEITDKKQLNEPSVMIPSWYSPIELLKSVIDQDFVIKNKTSSFFCKTIDDNNYSLTNYLIEHADRAKEIIQDKRAQLDAYLTSLTIENNDKEKLMNEQTAIIQPPNQTYEQQQLYYYTNKFWPLNQKDTIPIHEILSNTRSAFPNQGPLENAALNLFELSFNGETKMVRDILMHRQAYVDVCDSRGLTALHFAAYNVHVNVANLLLDFGANVNQLSDDCLTPLSIAFLLYYGNDPEQTINLALEHSEPILLNNKSTSISDTRRSSSKERLVQQSRATTNSPRNLTSRTSVIDENKILSTVEPIKLFDVERKDSYGYRLTEQLRNRMRDENFRQSVEKLIKLLLRRGADPNLCDWPVPILALAIRAGDQNMVELLIKKKVKINCQLNADRHANLTPLHIACGCQSANALDIVRILLENGADVNAESLAGGKEYLTLADQSVLDTRRINDVEQHGRTSLHIVCTREKTEETLAIVRLLLQHKANTNTACNGQTPLSLAIAVGNEALANLLLDHETTDPSIPLGLGNGNAFCLILSIAYESRWTYDKRLELIERFIAKNPKVLFPIRFGPKHSLGSSVDYAYYSYFSDARMSQAPYHSLSPQERIVIKQRKELLSYIAKRFREEAIKYDDFLRMPTPIINSEAPTRTPSAVMITQRTTSRARSMLTENASDIILRGGNEFYYCVTCGRSYGVRLSLCKRCHKVCFCSKPCKTAAWNSFHKQECQSPTLESPTNGALTTTKTMSSKEKLPSLRSSTHQTEVTRVESSQTSGTPLEKLAALDGALFKGNILSPKTSPMKSESRLPTLSVAKLIRQQRLKRGRSGGFFPPTLPTCLEGIPLSWNPIYNAPENYSYN